MWKRLFNVSLNHDLIQYISDPKVMSKLKPGLAQTEKELLPNESQDNFLKLSIIDESQIEIDSEIAMNPKRQLDSEQRLRKSKQIGYQFGLMIFDVAFPIENDKKLTRKEKNIKEAEELLEIPINARSDEELKDFLIYVKSDILAFCKDQRYFFK